MINGSTEWVDGDGFTYGAEPLLEEIKAAYAEPARNGGSSGFLLRAPPYAMRASRIHR